MKKITLILITLFAFIYANAQYTVPRALPYKDTRWVENTGVAGASYLFDSIVMFRNIADTQMKPLYPAMGYFQNFDGDSTLWIWDMVRWKKLAIGSSGGGTVSDFSAGNLSPLFTTSVATSTTTPALTFSLTNATGGTVFGNNTGSSAAPAYTSVPVLGIAGTTKGTIGLAGNTSGVVTIQPAAAAGTFNFNLPITAGTSGQVLTSAGGGSSAMTWTTPTTGTVTSVGLSMPSAFTVTNSPVTTSGTLTVTGAGTTAQYIRGDGTLSTFATDVRTSISLTTTGTSGVATYNNSTGVLNVPNYGAASGTLFAVAGQDATAAQVRSFNGASFNFTINSVDTFTLSGNKTVVEGINGLNLISTDTINELSSNYLLDKGVTAKYLATTTASWGYASASTVLVGLTATSTTLTGVGVPAYSAGTIKVLVEDQSTGAITQKQLTTADITGAGTVTTFSAGNLSPLFTTSVATASTTPALTFSLTNAAAGTVFGNATASAAAPSYTTHPIIGVASGSTGILGISGTTSGTVSLSAADAAGTWTMKLPTTGGTNLFFLQTDGSGNTTWAAPFTLTTTGSSGAATFSSGTLNIPQYSGGGITLSAIGSSPNANAATLTGTVLNLEPANTSFGGVVTAATQTFPTNDKTWPGNTFLTGTVQTNATSENGNFYIPSSASILGTPTTDTRYQIGVVASTQYRAQIGGGSTNATLTANAQFANVTIPNTTVTEASSGSHNAIAQLHIGSLTVTNAGATVTRTALLYLETNGGATGATNNGIYNPGNGVNVLSSSLSTTANTVSAVVTTSTGASTFGSGGANVNLAATQTASHTSNNVININASTSVTGTSGTATTVGVQGNVFNAANGAVVGTNYIGFRSDVENNGTGTVTNLIGYDANIVTGAGATASTAGTITNYYGFKGEPPNVADSTTITNWYHYYADSVTQFWRVTNPIYGFYQKGTYMKNFFAGALNIGYNGAATTPDASAQLELNSTTQGFLPPRMTATQGSAISSPAEGLLIYVTNTNGTFTAKGWWGWDGAAWNKLN